MLMTLELPETSVPAARRPVLQSRRDLINPPEHDRTSRTRSTELWNRDG